MSAGWTESAERTAVMRSGTVGPQTPEDAGISCWRSDAVNVETLSRVPVHVHLETGSGSAPFVVVLLLLCLVSAQLMDPAEEFLPALISMSVSMTTWLGWWVLSVFCVFLCRNMFSGPGFLWRDPGSPDGSSGGPSQPGGVQRCF